MMNDMSWLNDYGPELNEAWDENEEYEDVDLNEYRESYNDYISSYIY